MAEASKGKGRALYLEFRRERYTNQFIFTPEAVNPLNGQVVPVTMIWRQISDQHPKKMWKFKPVSGEGASKRLIDPSTKRIKNDQPFETAVEIAAENLSGIHIHLQAIITGEWVLYKNPVVIDITDKDIEDVVNMSTPEALIRRIVEARKFYDFEASYVASATAV